MKFRLLISALVIMPLFALAQSGNTPVPVTRPLTQLDSVVVEELFLSAMHEKILDNFSQAADMLDRLLRTDPANAPALYELANLKKLKENYTDAQALLEKAVAISPDNEWYWLSLAECYEKSNNVTRLEHAFSELTRINPAKPDYYFDLAGTYFIDKKYDEALKAYNQLQQITGPNDDILAGRQKIYLMQGNIDQAAADVEEMITANPGQTRYYLLLAELYNSNNLNDKALKILLDAEKAYPNNGQVHLALADIYRDKKNYQGCYDELKLAFAIPDMSVEQEIKIVSGYFPRFPDPDAKACALELSRILTAAHPDDAGVYAIYGDVLFENEKFADAKLAYRKSIGIDSTHYEVYERMVRIELSDNEPDNAIKDGETALSLFPNQAWMNYLVGLAWQQKKDNAKVLSYIKNAINLATDDKDLLSLCYSSIGDVYHEQNDDKNSDGAYDKALAYDPDNAFTLNNYAYYLSVRGEQLDKAAQMAAHANQLQPNTSSFEDTYAWILFKQKNYADAKTWIEKAVLHDKTNNPVQEEHYGDIMFYLGNTDAAVQNWKKAKSYGEQSPVLERKINERKYIE
jgi:tetratricopeptide (TPR) repeat protein